MHCNPNLTRRSLLAGLGGMLLAGCAGKQNAPEAASTSEPASEPVGSSSSSSAETAEALNVRVASLKGPTSIGLVRFMQDVKEGYTAHDFQFTISTAADEILPLVIKGDVDIALIPANAASVLYNKTEHGVSVIDINTLGVLNVVTANPEITDFASLAGKTIYLTGKGAVPEYTVNYLLAQAGIAENVTLEFKDEPTEVVAVLSQDPSAIGILPQPFATAACVKNEALSAVLDLTDVWNETVTDGSQSLTGVTIARKEFLESSAGENAVWEFLHYHQQSVDAVNADPAAAAPLVVEAGIIDAEPVAAKAIPNCHLVCITDDEMETALKGFLNTLYEADPSSVGGALPEDDFYYKFSSN